MMIHKQINNGGRNRGAHAARSCKSKQRWVLICRLMLFISFTPPLFAQQPERAAVNEINPLVQKEKMIHDRFQRFEDRVFRLREQLSEQEPENADRLTRTLQRAGELGLSDTLEEIIELLHDPSALQDAVDTQADWIEQVDQLLAILLARDSDNEQRKDEIQRLLAYNEKVSRILADQKGLRDQAAQSGLTRRMAKQLDQAIRRINELLKRQQELSQQTQSLQASEKAPGVAKQQNELSRDTQQLAEDVQRLSRLEPDASKDSPELDAARSHTDAAAQSLQSGAKAMSQASLSLQQSQNPQAGQQQKDARQALRKARQQLQQAREKLEEQSSTEKMADRQDKLADRTGDLAEQMQKDALEDSPSDQQGQSGTPGRSSTPGSQNLKQAQGEMKGASKGLKQNQPQDAVENQDRAIEQLEQAQRALEEELNKLRKEERGEMLRDLEIRFREMLSKQRAINEGTVILDQFGKKNFKREQRLQLADLSTQENTLAQQAATCLHILEEDATTVIFPRVVGQLSQDMAHVARRLTDQKVGALTQAVEKEIVETLEQLLGAIQQMQQENEQGGQPGRPGSKENQALLPTSSELKLLRASQQRVNTRTEAIAAAIEEGTESLDTGAEALQTVAERQKECASMATEMRDRKELPQ